MKIKLNVLCLATLGYMAQSQAAQPAWFSHTDSISSSIEGLTDALKADKAVYKSQTASMGLALREAQYYSDSINLVVDCAKSEFTRLKNELNTCCTNANAMVESKTDAILDIKMQTLAVKSSAIETISSLDASINSLSDTLSQVYSEYCTLVGEERSIADEFITNIIDLKNQYTETREEKKSFLDSVNAWLDELESINNNTISELNEAYTDICDQAAPSCTITAPYDVTGYIPAINSYVSEVEARSDVTEPEYTCAAQE